MPTVSVCLPVYNGANYLPKAIESILAQEFEDFELLISNDCSTDATSSIIEQYAARDNRIKTWTNKRKLKLFGNYNECMERASGKYIKLFAHDDLLEPTLLGNLVSVLEKYSDVSLVSSTRHWIDAKGKVIESDSEIASKTMRPFKKNTRLSSHQAVTSTLRDVVNWLGEPSSQMFRKEQFDGGYDTSFKQIGDLEYSFRLLNNGDYYFLADDVCYLRRHAEDWSTARGFDLAAFMDWFLLGSKYKNSLDSINLTSEEYCLNVIKALTRNFESTLYEAQSLGQEQRRSMLTRLCNENDPLSFFKCEKSGERDLPTEFRAMAAIALLQSAILENELRQINEEVAQPYTDGKERPVSDIRAGIVRALTGIKSTLREKDKEIEALRTALSDMGNSMSWKVTEPLRVIKKGRAP